ncbi:hypothetical protein Pmani_010359 [Petrolisthes manimaculis]|uniref:Uncharacterized protein n=1 Tax=Petrolisthes manimaculis TaxID=1843537 RepID=A0AAE1UGW0_9EUCA|nr:hypothetical protein Pmani_010359 [Petrolisthes manimaculis]
MARLPGATRKGVKRHYMGKIGDFNCKLCRALLWNGEKHSLCCSSGGQIRRTELSEIRDLKALYNGTSELSERFLKGISGFNMFSFTSFENEAIVTILYDYMVNNNACLKGLLGEYSSTKSLMSDYIKNHGEITEMSITLKSSEGLNTREHKGVYHLLTSSSQVGAIVNLDSDTDHLSITVRSPKPDSKYRVFILNHHNYFYDWFQYPLIIPNGDIGCHYQLRAGD